MSEYNFKVGALKFDVEKERDIIEFLKYLGSKRMLSQFIGALVRAVLSGKKLENENLEQLRQIAEEYGYDEQREEFFSNIEKNLQEMKEKLDFLHSEIEYLYTLEKAGTKINLSQRARNLLVAQHLMEEQLRVLCFKLGISTLTFKLKSENEEIDIRVDKFLDRLFTKYADILLDNFNESREERKEEKITKHITNKEPLFKEDKKEIKKDEIIDFGDETDWKLLENFIG